MKSCQPILSIDRSTVSCDPDRLRQQNAAELKNGGMVGGARDVFGSWRGRELHLDRDRKMAEDASGRLTG